MTTRPVRRAVPPILLLLLATELAAMSPPVLPSWSLRPLISLNEAVPPLPDPADRPVQLVFDDNGAESAFGVADSTARQFLWFQRFSPSDPNFGLREVWVLFPADPLIVPGDAVQLVVYQDSDRDPTNGADLLVARDDTVQVADDGTFSVYTFDPPVEVRGGGDVLVGVVNRYVTMGVTPLNEPAALDTDTSAGRAWVATWIGDPPDPPVLPADESMFLIDDVAPGNWMIRAFGTRPPAIDVPALGGVGTVTLAVLLTGAGALLLRRR